MKNISDRKEDVKWSVVHKLVATGPFASVDLPKDLKDVAVGLGCSIQESNDLYVTVGWPAKGSGSPVIEEYRKKLNSIEIEKIIESCPEGYYPVTVTVDNQVDEIVSFLRWKGWRVYAFKLKNGMADLSVAPHNPEDAGPSNWSYFLPWLALEKGPLEPFSVPKEYADLASEIGLEILRKEDHWVVLKWPDYEDREKIVFLDQWVERLILDLKDVEDVLMKYPESMFPVQFYLKNSRSVWRYNLAKHLRWAGWEVVFVYGDYIEVSAP